MGYRCSLSGGDGSHVALLDACDAAWFVSHPFGSYTHEGKHTCYLFEASRKPPRKAHRLLLKADNGVLIDHVNGNGLDIRRNNLRVATSVQNTHNSRRRRHARSMYKGVWLHRLSGLYYGAVTALNGSRHSIGYYKTENEAALAHDAVAHLLHGEFAYLNFPDKLMAVEEMLSHKSIARVYELTNVNWHGAAIEEAAA